MIFRIPSTLKSRLLLLAVLGMLPFVFLIAVRDYEAREIAKQNAAQHAIHLTSLASNTETLQIRSAEQLLKTLTVVPDVRDPERCNEFMADFLIQNPRYANVGVIDKNGELVCSGLPFTPPVSAADRIYFRNAISLDGFAVGEYMVGSVTRVASLNVGYPLRDDDGDLRGVIFAAMNLHWINIAIVGGHIHPDTSSFIIDRNGIILANYPNPEAWIGKNIRNTEIVKLILADQKEGTAEMFGPDGIKRQFAYTPLPISNKPGEAFVAVGIPTAVAVSGLTPQIVRDLLILLLVIVTVILIGYVGSERLVFKRLRNLTDATTQFARKKFSTRINIERNDEIGILSRTFNAMAEQLEGLYGKLEQKVMEKTSQLNETVEKLKTQKQLLETLLENLPVGVVVAEAPSGDLRTVNKMGKALLGFKHKPRNMRECVFVREDGSPIPEKELPMFDTLIEGKTFINHTGICLKNGIARPIALRMSGALVRSEGQEGDSAIFVFEDMTKELAIDKAKSEFVSLASHQLRTPLTATNWFCELLLEGSGGKLTKKQLGLLTQLHESNRRMVALVNSLLNVSRIEAGKFSVEPTSIDLPDFVNGMLIDYSPRIKHKNLRVETDYDEVDGYRGDPKLLRVILENYLLNAINYTPDRGRILISLSKTNKEITITVKDTGYGIPKNEQDKIFSKLFRGSNIRNVDTEGSGLGLYLVKTLVEQVGGRVWFESEEKKGSSFYAALPVEGMSHRKGTTELIL